MPYTVQDIAKMLETLATYATGVLALDEYLSEHPEDVEALLLKTNVSFDTYYNYLSQHREINEHLESLLEQYTYILTLVPENIPAKSGWVWANIQLGVANADPDLMEAYLADLQTDEGFLYRGLQYELDWLNHTQNKERALVVLDQLIGFVKVKYADDRFLIDKYNSEWYLEKMKVMQEMPMDMSQAILTMMKAYMSSFIYTNGYGYLWMAQYLVEHKAYDLLGALLEQAEHYFLMNTTQIDEYGFQLYELVENLVKSGIEHPKIIYHYIVILNNCHEAIEVPVATYRKVLFEMYDRYPDAAELQMAMSTYFYYHKKDYKNAIPYYEVALESGVAYPAHLARYIEAYFKVYQEAPQIPDRYFVENWPVLYYMSASFMRDLVATIDKADPAYEEMMLLCLKFHEKADILFESYFYGGTVSATSENTKENWAKLLNNYAIIYLHMDRFDDAVYVAEKGLGISPFWELNQKIALAHGHAGNYPAEELALKSLLDTNLKNVAYEEYLYHKVSLVDTLLKQNKKDEAVDTYKILREEFVTHLYTYGNSKIDVYLLEHFLNVEADIFELNTFVQMKITAYEELLRFYPKNTSIYAYIMMHLIESDNLIEANKYAEKVMAMYQSEADRDRSWAYLSTQYAYIKYKKGYYKEARNLLEPVLAVYPTYDYAKKLYDSIPSWNRSLLSYLGYY